MMTGRISKVIIFSAAVLILTGCFSKAVPDWQSTGFSHLESFKKEFLSGDDERASRSFEKAIVEIKKSGRVDILAKAYLTRCAVAVAALEKGECGEYLQIRDLLQDRKEDTYYAFITGNRGKVDERLLPEGYRPFFHALTVGSVADINKALEAMESPLSRVIAAGLSIKQGIFDETTIIMAIDTASYQGWKKTLVRYLEALKALYERNGEKARAERVQERINAMSLKK
ncbi:MAG: hypothetical protein JW736_04110 [Deltaproteobacteria bacterium]|nr:hypothetical protein [Deltaproteobacteria bacterium]MBN2687990.1 hypothetical protein [Deltaproteobacteria bacterium]